MQLLRLLVALASVAAVSASAGCPDLHFFVEEGQTLNGDLQNPPTQQTFHNIIYTMPPPGNLSPSAPCTLATTAVFTPGTPPPHHTVTPASYTPAVLAFALNADGTFSYTNIAQFDAVLPPNATQWNGYDSFTYGFTCDTVAPCTGTVYVNVLYTSAASQNTPRPPFLTEGGRNNRGVVCTGSCKDGAEGMWLARHTLPRLWDMQVNPTTGQPVAATLTMDGDGIQRATDSLTFHWSSNFAKITTYGRIANLAVRFPTFEIVEFTPGDTFSDVDVAGHVAVNSTGFDQSCLGLQGSTGEGKDVFIFNPDQLDGGAGLKATALTSWYQKFGGGHENCDVFTTEGSVCQYAPLLAPRPATSQDIDHSGVWRVRIESCRVMWEGQFTWNAMRSQTLHNTAKTFLISGATDGVYTITTEIYNQAVQPNSWTDPSRGFVEIDKKYLLTVVLNEDSDFHFELGIDIFTVDLQQFRYYSGSSEHSFGFNMIVYPKELNVLQQSAPDRRIKGYSVVEHEWSQPDTGACPGCAAGGLSPAPSCTHAVASEAEYEQPLPSVANGCGTGVAAVVHLYKGPSTSAGDCTNNADEMVVVGTPGISPSDPDNAGVCNTDFQNITLRGVATGSTPIGPDGDGFGFEGNITLTFLLFNGEHPHFFIQPQMYVQSISIDGAFAGSTSTCRGSPKWPVADPRDNDEIPDYICEEVDARTFGPTDWAAIFFDIKDVDAQYVVLKSLRIEVQTPGGATVVRFYPETDTDQVGTFWDPNYLYFNFRNLKTPTDRLTSPGLTAPAGVAPPSGMDFGFMFTPGAHNENVKILIYCTLSITNPTSRRRFAAAQAETNAENTIQERININRGTPSQQSSLALNNRAVEGSSENKSSSSSSSSGVTVIVLAAACAVLLAAVVGMVLYVVRVNSNSAPKRVSSTA